MTITEHMLELLLLAAAKRAAYDLFYDQLQRFTHDGTGIDKDVIGTRRSP
jgi:hypothetical protein